MAVYCRGKRLVQLHEGYITTKALENEDIEEVKEMSVVKAIANADSSRRLDLILDSKSQQCQQCQLRFKSFLVISCHHFQVHEVLIHST